MPFFYKSLRFCWLEKKCSKYLSLSPEYAYLNTCSDVCVRNSASTRCASRMKSRGDCFIILRFFFLAMLVAFILMPLIKLLFEFYLSLSWLRFAEAMRTSPSRSASWFSMALSWPVSWSRLRPLLFLLLFMAAAEVLIFPAGTPAPNPLLTWALGTLTSAMPRMTPVLNVLAGGSSDVGGGFWNLTKFFSLLWASDESDYAFDMLWRLAACCWDANSSRPLFRIWPPTGCTAGSCS